MKNGSDRKKWVPTDHGSQNGLRPAFFRHMASVPPDYTGPARPGDYRINLGCVHDVDVLALDIEVINGKAF